MKILGGVAMAMWNPWRGCHKYSESDGYLTTITSSNFIKNLTCL